MKRRVILDNTEYRLEIIAFDIQSCLNIAHGGADRIELCADPGSGGTTPAYGTIKMARTLVDLPVFPMIRPRGGDFLYSGAELEVMARDIEMCKELECPGVVLGLLNRDGEVDVRRLRTLVALARPMQVTFHRAFDHCRDPEIALEQIIESGCHRILTSGQAPKAADGADRLKELVSKAAGRIIIMPGSGINPQNITQLAASTGAKEFHASLRCWKDTRMNHKNPAFPAAEHQRISVESRDVAALKAALIR